MQTEALFRAHRPALHFTPEAGWMNDPNGLFYDGVWYHLYYQHNPFGTGFGPMHWGHARSRDLTLWERLPTALAPDRNGVIFSGSVVLDRENLQGLAAGVPLVTAVFTHHSETAGESQSLAYSLDGGMTFQKAPENPVLSAPGEKDFRDPKVFWHAESRKWVMVLAAGHAIRFYGAADLRHWTLLSAWTPEGDGRRIVWECPDLFPLDGKWVLTASISAADNGLPGMAYWIGSFDGTAFCPDGADSSRAGSLAGPLRYLSYGPDDYAAVTFYNTGARRLLLGWMSAWAYAAELPDTGGFRGAMTLPRELSLRRTQAGLRLFQWPAAELLCQFIETDAGCSAALPIGAVPFLLTVTGRGAFAARLYAGGDCFAFGYDGAAAFVDRTGCSFETAGRNFRRRVTAPLEAPEETVRLTAIVDVTSVELFVGEGEALLVSLCYPDAPFSHAEFTGDCCYRLSRWNRKGK